MSNFLSAPGGDDNLLQQRQQNYLKNQQWAVQQPSYQTQLTPQEQQDFSAWVSQSGMQYDPSPTSDYDMAGFWKALVSGDPRAEMSVNPNDGLMHETDLFKTPYHESFSRESQWAKPNAPAWNDQDQLIDRKGRVVFDERARNK